MKMVLLLALAFMATSLVAGMETATPNGQPESELGSPTGPGTPPEGTQTVYTPPELQEHNGN